MIYSLYGVSVTEIVFTYSKMRSKELIINYRFKFWAHVKSTFFPLHWNEQNYVNVVVVYKHQNSILERSDLPFEAWKPVFLKRDMGVYMIDLSRVISKPVFKLDLRRSA